MLEYRDFTCSGELLSLVRISGSLSFASFCGVQISCGLTAFLNCLSIFGNRLVCFLYLLSLPHGLFQVLLFAFEYDVWYPRGSFG